MPAKHSAGGSLTTQLLCTTPDSQVPESQPGDAFGSLTFVASDGVGQFQLRIELPHLLDDFSCLKSQLIGWGKAQTLERQKDNMLEVSGSWATLALKRLYC